MLELQAGGGAGWSAGLGSNLGWALSSFGASKIKGQSAVPCADKAAHQNWHQLVHDS